MVEATKVNLMWAIACVVIAMTAAHCQIRMSELGCDPDHFGCKALK